MTIFDAGQDRKANPVLAREQGLVQRMRRFLGDLEPAGRALLVGYSGGADSLALLGLLADLTKPVGVELSAVHVDHGVRAGSASDADLARRVANQLDVPIEVRTVSAADLARHSGVGREEALRRERYRIFADVASGPGDDAVLVLAHHQRDQAETVLLHLVRGAGIRGAAGMRLFSTMRVPWWDGDDGVAQVGSLTVWRPLLAERAEKVRAYATSLGLPIAEDPSNADESFRRNAIRYAVLPVIEKVSPGATGNLARFAALAGEDSDLLDDLARAELASIGDPQAIDRAWLRGLASPIRRRVLQFWIAARVPAGLEVTLNRLDEVLRVAETPGPVRMVELGQGIGIEVSRTSIRAILAMPS